MNLIVLTPEKEIFQGEIISVKVPGSGGSFEILKDHAPIVSSLVEGEVKINSTSGESKVFNITQGFVEVLGKDISLLVQGVS